mmetsp:Transcript_45657/g.102900  ORF Transcript_45657/g.102900 Transcript_45657/m.102900 type:complete len:207 (-) Transcript_45657:234-854(-)
MAGCPMALRSMALCHLQLNLGDSFARVQVLGARLAAIHDRLAPVHLESVVEERQALLLLSVPAVCQPTVRLQQDGGPQVLILIPPVRGARRRAARAQDALVEAVQLCAVGLRLVVFYGGIHTLFGDQEGLHALVLLVEVGHVRDQVLQHVHVRQGVDLGAHACVGDLAEARKRVGPIHVHGARAADALAARPPERERRVHLVLNLD